MNRLPLRIALRYSTTRSGFLSFVTVFAVAGLALGTAVLVTVLTVMNGFERELRERVLGVLPHAVLMASGGFRDWRAVAEPATAHPAVVGAAPFSRGAALLAAADRVRAVELTGILPAVESRISILDERMIAGDLDALRPGEFEVVVGRGLAAELDLEVGDPVTVVMPEPRVTLAGVFPRQKQLQVGGVFEIGTELDDSGAFVHLQDANRLLRVPREAEGIRLALTDLFDSERVVREVLDHVGLPGLQAYDWRYTHGNLYEAIGLQKRIMFVLLSLLVAVAAFNVVSMLTMVVRNRRGDIAILRTMGLAPGPLMAVFFIQGSLIAVAGIALGLVGGCGLALVLPDLVASLQGLAGRNLLAEYFVRELPVDFRPSDLLQVAAVALAIALATTWWPARRALAVAPAEELRHE